MESPLISIITPTYNYGHYIGDTLDCILAQTYQNWECVIVDDGSVDRTISVVDRYLDKDNRFKYIYQNNQGVSAARNNGIRNSSGMYLQFLDADDLIESEKLERQLDFLKRNSEVDIVYGSGRYFSTKEEGGRSSLVLGEELSWMPIIQGDSRSALLALTRRPFVIHAPLIRRSVFETVGYFDEKWKSCEDWRLWIHCALQGKLFRHEKLENSMALYRLHPESLCANRTAFFAGIRRLRKEIEKMIDDPQVLELNQRLAAEYEGYIGILYVNENRTLSGMLQCFKAGSMAQEMREKVKWWYCAMVAPFAPKDQFARIVASPVAQSFKSIIRYHFRIAS